MKEKKNLLIIISLWFLLMSGSFFYNYQYSVKEQERVSLESARSFFDNIVITRLWNARHNGIYVPVTQTTQPNPYLNVPMREIVVDENLTLTKINPAFMTRQISELATNQGGIQFHITSLNPIRPENKATQLEKQTLLEFENGLKEKSVLIKEESSRYNFYMAPLMTKKSCLKCHEEQGYKVGDIRGGISVTTPYIIPTSLKPMLIGHILITIIGLIGIIIAHNKLSHAYQVIKKQAILDPLTGVPNRRSFSENIVIEYNRSKRNNEPLALIMCDVDKFKIYNDTYGHQAGDECLITVAKAISSSLKRPSDFCARYGGEEFIVVLANTDLQAAQLIAERICKNLEDLQTLDKTSLTGVVTLSLGISISSNDRKETYESIIKEADEALYKAKENGRNRIEYFHKG